MRIELPGIVPAAFTPMLQNGDINLEKIDDYAIYLGEAGVKNVFILGTAGEGCSLTNEERMKVAERWMVAAKDRVPNVIVHVGTDNLADTKILAKHAESIGATAIAAVASFFFRPQSAKELALYFAEIAKAAPKTPLLYYHMPSGTGVNLNVKEFLDEISAMDVPTFTGTKFTGHDLCDFGMCVQHYGEQYTLCYGYDEQVMAGLFLGAHACVGSTYNYALKLYQQLFEACKREDVKTARDLQHKSQKYISFLFSVGFDVGVNKALLGRIAGIDVGPPRLPLMAPTEEKLQKIMNAFQEMGFFDWIK